MFRPHSRLLPIISKNVRKFNTRSQLLPELKRRGMIAQVTSQELDKVLEQRRIKLYAGVDPSADSLHVGNLAVLMALLHFFLSGHEIFALIGGATGRVGDPGGRHSERQLLAEELVDKNANAISQQVERFFYRGERFARSKSLIAPNTTLFPPRVLNNLAWFSKLNVLDFMRFPGKFSKMSNMLARDSVRTRLARDQGISFAEFSYQLLQGYDFYVLNKDWGVELQIGGSDQWGNIVSGIDLVSRMQDTAEIHSSDLHKDRSSAFGLTIPLLTTSTGEKFGKSAGNAIWLDPQHTSVYDFYQFFLRVNDADVEHYLRYLTLIPNGDIESLIGQHKKSPEKREAQKRLAAEITELIHGEKALKEAQEATSILFDDSIIQISVEKFLSAIGNHPRLKNVNRVQVEGQLATKLVSEFGLVRSHGQAKSLVQAGGLYLNNRRIEHLERRLTGADFIDQSLIIFRAGKDEHLILAIR